MPLPKPNDSEGHDKWIDRCMADDAMVEEYEESDQRLAVCESIWDDSRSMTMPDLTKRSIRTLPLACAEVRIENGAREPRIVGYASVFYDGTPSTEFRLWDDMVERIMPGAFDKTLRARDDVRALFNHDPNMILGRTSAKTLSLSVDKRGLHYDVEPGDTTVAEDVVKHIRRGDVTGSSFGFRVTDQTWRTEDKIEIREIRGVELLDVGPVTYPAYEGTDSQVRKEELAEIRSAHEAWRAGRSSQKQLRERAKRVDLTRRRNRLQSGQGF
jgi:HK97 family phage prohead protease